MREKGVFRKYSRNRTIHKPEISEFPCLHCGTCCSRYQPQISLSEARTISIKLNISWESFISDYIDPRWPGTQSFLLRQINGACIFLKPTTDKKQHLCLIHDFKPACCLDWQPGINRSECLDGLKANWDITLDSRGRILGTPQKIQALNLFIMSLNKPSSV